jgi:signal peptidase I
LVSVKSIDNPPGSSQRLRRGGLRCIRVVLGLLVVACAALLAIVVAGSLTGAWRLLPVRTGSMTPHAPQGSVVIVHPMPASQLRTGQVIAFRAPVPGHPLVVHRVYQLTPAPGGPVVRTKGDANAGPDPWQFRIRGATVWRGGRVVPELGNAMFLLETPHARVVALAAVVALLTAMSLVAIWTSGLLAPIVWRAPEIPWAPIAWRADPLRGWQARRHQWRQARRGRRDARRSPPAAPGGPRPRRRTERVAALVSALAVGVAATIGSGAFALFTGNAAATATESTTQLAAPTALSAGESGSGASATVTLNWTATTSARATGTRVFRGTVSGGPYSQITQIVGLATTTFVDKPGAGTFFYVVEAYYTGNGANWTSANSNQVSATVPYTAYVGNFTSGTITPINTGTNAAAATIANGSPSAIAITPDGTKAYVANENAGTVTPITLATKTVGAAITVGTKPWAIAITPDGTKAYVANQGSNTVTPITVSTNTAGTAITVGTAPEAIAITPDGTKAYVANHGSNTVTPITVSTNTAGTAITVGTGPEAIAITPDGTKAYVANNGSGTLTPITVATNTAGATIAVGSPSAIAITPDGKTAFVADFSAATVTPVTLATNAVGSTIAVGTNPDAVAITPNGVTAYVTDNGSAKVTPITVATKTAGAAITVGTGPDAVAIK